MEVAVSCGFARSCWFSFVSLGIDMVAPPSPLCPGRNRGGYNGARNGYNGGSRSTFLDGGKAL